MRHTTHSLSVQVGPDGRLDVHSWRACYASSGRQLPASHGVSDDVTIDELRELFEFFLVGVEADRRRAEAGLIAQQLF